MDAPPHPVGRGIVTVANSDLLNSKNSIKMV